ncbi:unnamed protein product [Chrysoparadoxa australica]
MLSPACTMKHYHNSIKAPAARSPPGACSDSSCRYEAMFKAQTVGLVTKQEFMQAREEAEQGANDAREKDEKAKADQERKKKKKKKKKASVLSFGDDLPEDDGDEDETPQRKKKIKNPSVDTSFLPDRDRESMIQSEKQKLKQEWLEEQERMKQDKLKVTYSYWDGTGHRREVVLTKGATIGKFLDLVRKELGQEFSELRNISAEHLLYIKEDLIIPQSYSFYDLIVTKARGKSGPLFHFDVHDDVRLLGDHRIEKDESHPGKVVERRWYERNKHIFPASRWELYDPNADYGRYTIHGDGDKEEKK